MPSWTSLIHFHHPASSVIPRLSVTGPYLTWPGSCFMTGIAPGLFSRCSIGVTSVLSPEASLNWAMITPSTSTWNA